MPHKGATHPGLLEVLDAMKALVLETPGNIHFKEVPKPIPGPEEVLVQVKAVGICGSDVHGMDGSTGRRIPPIIMGHEAAGEIVEVGSAVSDWHIGDRVTFDSTIYCGACEYCQAGLVNLCNDRRVFGVSCDRYRQHGAFAEFIAVPQRILYHLPETVSFIEGAMVEPLSVAFHAVNLAPVRKKDTVVVIGAGTIGLLIIQVLKLMGVKRIIAVDINPTRLDLALQLGARTTIQSKNEEPLHKIEGITHGEGVDVVFEAVGIPETTTLATNILRKKGTLVLVGNLTPKADLFLQLVVTRELTLKGSCASAGEYPVCIEAIANGDIALSPLISATAPLSEGVQYFHHLYQGSKEYLKVILQP
jgi:L-iditol 2-dehydrogenase